MEGTTLVNSTVIMIEVRHMSCSWVKVRGGRQQESLGRQAWRCGLRTQRSRVRNNGVVTTCTQARRDGHRFWRKKTAIQRRTWPSSHSSNIHAHSTSVLCVSAMEAAGCVCCDPRYGKGGKVEGSL